jgi:16S rRNA (guanine966-N2)-methyltransferase
MLEANLRVLGPAAVRLVRADALEFLRADTGAYDVVFLDPPYAMGGRDPLLDRVRPRLAPAALVYVEGPQAAAPPAGWEVHREARAGAVFYQLLRAVE